MGYFCPFTFFRSFSAMGITDWKNFWPFSQIRFMLFVSTRSKAKPSRPCGFTFMSIDKTTVLVPETANNSRPELVFFRLI